MSDQPTPRSAWALIICGIVFGVAMAIWVTFRNYDALTALFFLSPAPVAVVSGIIVLIRARRRE